MFTQSSRPNQIMLMSSALATGTHRHHDEDDLEEVEEEGEEEHEGVGEEQEADLLRPGSCRACARSSARHSPLEHQAEDRGADQMKTTIAVMRMVEVIASQSIVTESRRCIAASTMAPTAPIAPASVGVASRGRWCRAPEDQHQRGHHAPEHLADQGPAAQRARREAARPAPVRLEDRDPEDEEREERELQDRGPIAPRYMSPTETPSWSASTISTSEGGITWVMVPDAAITPVAIRMS